MKRFGLLAMLLASGSAAFAQDAPKPNDLFKQLDKNNDGKLVKSEVPEDQARFFERLVRIGDEDKNGELTLAEFEKATKEEPRRPEASGPGAGPDGRRPQNFDPKQMFERMDENKDGKLSRNEMPEFMRDRFGKVFDELKKDAITFEEFQQAREKLGVPGGGPEGGRPGAGNPEEAFKRFDSNGDGKLKLEEIPEQARRFMAPMFERLGKGASGEITKDEFVKAAEQFRQGQGQGRPEGERRPEGQAGERRPDAPREGDRRPDAPREGAPREGGPRPEGREGGPRPEAGPGGPHPRPKFFQLLDRDNNGRISKDELAKAGELLAELDENKDGQLDPRELMGPPPGEGGREGGRPPMPAGDRERPRESDRARPDAARPDAARKPQEGDARREGDRPKPEGERPRGEGDRPKEGERGAKAPAADPEFFKKLDKNGDGKISKEEAPERLADSFGRIDTNNDGFLDRAEIEKAMSRRDR